VEMRSLSDPRPTSQIYLRAHLPVCLLPDHRPLLALTVVDHALAEQLVEESVVDEDTSVASRRCFSGPRDRWVGLLFGLGGSGGSGWMSGQL